MPNYFTGVGFIVKVESAPASGTYIDIACVRSNTGSIANEQIDVTTKCTMPWRTAINGGLQQMTLSGSGVFNDGTDMPILKNAADANTILNYQLESESGDTYTGPFTLTSFERTGEHNAEETFDFTLESAGVIVAA